MEALKERGLLRQNAPHLVHDLAFVVPELRRGGRRRSTASGLKVYDLLAGKYGFGPSRILSRDETLARIADAQDRRPARRRGLLRRPVRRRAAADQPGRDRGRAGRRRCSTTRASIGSRKAPTGFVDGLVAATRKAAGSSDDRGARASSTPPAPFCDARAPAGRPDAPPHDRAEPGHSPRASTARSCPATRRSWCRTRATAGSCSPSRGTATPSSARPTRRSPTSTLEPRPLSEEIDFILETAGRYLAQGRRRAPTS